MNNFMSGQIRRSLQRFEDFTGDLRNSNSDTFDDRLNLLMDFCKNDQVFNIIHHQLLGVNTVNFDDWYNEVSLTRGGVEGSGILTFPTKLDERLSIMYQLLFRINGGTLRLFDFAIDFFSGLDDYAGADVDAFNNAIVEPLVRELSYRIKDLEEKLPENDKDQVPLAQIQIIHNATNVIQQSATGSNINQTANIDNNSEIASLFDDLRGEIRREVSDDQLSDLIEVVDSAESLATSDKPKKSSVGALLNSLPTLGNIGSISSAILSAISTFS